MISSKLANEKLLYLACEEVLIYPIYANSAYIDCFGFEIVAGVLGSSQKSWSSEHIFQKLPKML